MRRLSLFLVFCCSCVCAIPQSTASNEALLNKTRALYDAPFTRNLVSFDCAVEFDWRKHITEVVGTVPPALTPALERFQAIEHRVFVDRSGATVSAIPKPPDLSDLGQVAQLEKTFTSIVKAGIDTWIPFSTNVILPVPPTKFGFQETHPGYKLVMTGTGVEATLYLTDDLHLAGGESQAPQPLLFTTEFVNGPSGYLLKSTTTGPPNSPKNEAHFTYTYQAVDGFQIPSLLTVAGATPEIWRYSLTGCKVMQGVTVKVSPEKSDTK
jgi:hypothetical protein